MATPVTDPAILAQLNETAPEAEAQPSVAKDVAKQTAAGIPSALAAAAGVGGDVREMVGSGTGWLANKFGSDPEAARARGANFMRAASPVFMGPTSQQIKDTAHNVTGVTLPEAETRPGQYARTVSEFAFNPLSYAGPGSAFMKAMQAISAGTGSEWLGGIASGKSSEPYARILGAVGGALFPRAAMRAITPLPVPANRQAAVDTLAQEGIEASAGQQSGSKALRYAESELGDSPGAGGAATRQQERTGRQFTNAILARVGERWAPNERITQVVDRAHNRNGQMFDDLAARTNSPYDTAFINDLYVGRDQYNHLFVDPLRAPIVDNILEHAVNKMVRSPNFTGEEYRALRSRIERTRRGTKDPEVQEYLATVRQAMDDLVERHAAPGLMEAWRETRNQYRNLLVLDRVATAAGEQAASGHVSPAQLRNATVNLHGRRNYARGHGDFADLARAGEEVLTPLPQSGTAPRSFVRNTLGALGAGIGYASHGDPGAVMAGAAVGMGMPAAAGRVLMNPVTQGYLRNQAMTRALRHGSSQGSASLRAAINARRNLMDEEE